jgi:purine nucleosidase
MIRIILDCDPGVDDAVAILFALASPELDVRGITLVGGNVALADVCDNARRIVALSGRSNVPIFAGCPKPLVRPQLFGKYSEIGAFSEAIVPRAMAPLQNRHAVSFIVDAAMEAAAADDPITLCCTGPLTNIALALVQDERITRGIARIVMMGGAFSALGNRTPWAEFNVLADPHAAETVLTSGIEVVMLPLDVTFEALMTAAHLDELRVRGGAPGRALVGLIEAHDRSDVARFGGPGGPLHDPTVIAWVLAPELFRLRPAGVGVECQGVTAGHSYADFHRKSSLPVNARVAQEIDVDGFFALLLERLSRYGVSCGSK